MEEKLLKLTYELVDEIKESSSFLKLKRLKKNIDNDQKIKELINNFNNTKSKYEEVAKYSKYHPDFKKVQKELVEIKEKVFTNSTIKEFKDLEKEIQYTLDKISREIAKSISQKIKHPNEIGFIKK